MSLTGSSFTASLGSPVGASGSVTSTETCLEDLKVCFEDRAEAGERERERDVGNLADVGIDELCSEEDISVSRGVDQKESVVTDERERVEEKEERGALDVPSVTEPKAGEEEAMSGVMQGETSSRLREPTTGNGEIDNNYVNGTENGVKMEEEESYINELGDEYFHDLSGTQVGASSSSAKSGQNQQPGGSEFVNSELAIVAEEGPAIVIKNSPTRSSSEENVTVVGGVHERDETKQVIDLTELGESENLGDPGNAVVIHSQHIDDDDGVEVVRTVQPVGNTDVVDLTSDSPVARTAASRTGGRGNFLNRPISLQGIAIQGFLDDAHLGVLERADELQRANEFENVLSSFVNSNSQLRYEPYNISRPLRDARASTRSNRRVKSPKTKASRPLKITKTVQKANAAHNLSGNAEEINKKLAASRKGKKAQDDKNANDNGGEGSAGGSTPSVVPQCTVCLEDMQTITSTTCGHLFCHDCITKSIKAHNRCPICRKKLTLQQIHPIFM
eukprot:Nk52_evm91s1737 gene=Nk52_evmTU91s1737